MVYDSRAASPDHAFDDDHWSGASETSEREVAPFEFAWASDDDDEPDLDYADDDEDVVDLDEDDDEFLADLDEDEDDDELDLDVGPLDDDYE